MVAYHSPIEMFLKPLNVDKNINWAKQTLQALDWYCHLAGVCRIWYSHSRVDENARHALNEHLSVLKTFQKENDKLPIFKPLISSCVDVWDSASANSYRSKWFGSTTISLTTLTQT